MYDAKFDKPYTGNTSYDTEKDHSWTKDANCLGMDTAIFEITDVEDLEDGTVPAREWFASQRAKFVEAKMACDACPVRKECFEDAREDDFAWTYRANMSPLVAQYQRIYARNNLNRLRIRTGEEPEGPVISLVGAGEALGRSDRITTRYKPRTRCVNGHEMTPENTRPQASRDGRCLACHQAKIKRRAEARRLTRVAARDS